MKVKDIMTGEPRTCSLDTTLAAAAALMLDGDCGIPPMVTDGKLFGVVTDRDIVLASGPRPPVRDAEVVSTLQTICAHPPTSTHIAAA